MTALLLLFGTAFAAATILPFYSEFLLLALLSAGEPPLALWLAASAGNTLGAAVNWWLGRYCSQYAGARWFPVGQRELARAQAWFGRYGVWTLLLSWLPLGGDALTFVAGLMRVRFRVFLLLVAIGKSARYAVVILGHDVLMA